MRCPHCGFKHLEVQERCLRCRKPLRAEDGSFPESSDSSIEIRSLQSPAAEESIEASAEVAGSLAIEPTADGLESLLGAESDSRSMELVLEREDEACEEPGEENLRYTFGDSGSAAAVEETGDVPDEASDLALAADEASMPEPEADPEKDDEAAAPSADVELVAPEPVNVEPEVELEVMAGGIEPADEDDYTEPAPPEALAPDEESDTTELLEGSGGIEEDGGEDAAPDEAEALPRSEESSPGDAEVGLSEESASVPLDDEEMVDPEDAAFPETEADAPPESDEARFEREVVAALAGEITAGSLESTPGLERAAEEDSAGGADVLAGDGSLADGGDDEVSGEASAGLDPLSVPGDDTARAVMAIMDAEAVPEDLPFEESVIEMEGAESGADSMSVGTDSMSVGADSAGVGTEERRLDAFFNQGEESAASADEDDSKIELGAPAEPALPPEPLCLPLGDDSTGGSTSTGRGRGVRSVRVTRPRKTRDRTAMFLTIRRAAAGGFDLLIWIVLGWVLFRSAQAVTGLDSLHGTAFEWAYLVLMPMTVITAVLAMIYGGLFGAMIGRTPGMMIFGLRLMGPDGGSPRPARAFVRTGVLLLGILPLGAGLIFVLLGGDKGGLHDRLSGLRVERI